MKSMTLTDQSGYTMGTPSNVSNVGNIVPKSPIKHDTSFRYMEYNTPCYVNDMSRTSVGGYPIPYPVEHYPLSYPLENYPPCSTPYTRYTESSVVGYPTYPIEYYPPSYFSPGMRYNDVNERYNVLNERYNIENGKYNVVNERYNEISRPKSNDKAPNNFNQYNVHSPGGNVNFHDSYRNMNILKEVPRCQPENSLLLFNDNQEPEPIKPPVKSYLWCHQCKKKNRNVVYCSKYESGFCSKKYCKKCIEKHYNEDFVTIDQKNWICMFCRDTCLCAFCRRKRGEKVPKRIMKKRKLDNEQLDTTHETKKQRLE